jgi:hypothetical protein
MVGFGMGYVDVLIIFVLVAALFLRHLVIEAVIEITPVLQSEISDEESSYN